MMLWSVAPMCPFRLKAPLIFEMLMPSLSRSQIVDIVDGIGFFAYPSPFSVAQRRVPPPASDSAGNLISPKSNTGFP